MKSDTQTELVQSIRKFLRRIKRRIAVSLMLESLLCFVLAAACFLCALLLLDRFYYLQRTMQIVPRMLFTGIVLGIVLLFVRDYFRKLRLPAVVSFLEQKYRLLKGRLFAAIECSPEDPCFSSALVYANREDVERILPTLPHVPLITKKHIRLGRIAALPLLLLFALVATTPQRTLSTLARFGGMSSPVPTSFVVFPGNQTVEQGSDFDVVLLGLSGGVYRPRLLLNDEHSLLKEREPGIYSCTIERVKQPFTYQVSFSDTASPVFFVDVVEHPRIEQLLFTVHPPPYTGEPDRLTREFDIYALKGSRVDFEGVSSQPIDRAMLLFDDSLSVSAGVDSCAFAGSFRVDTTRSFVLELESTKGLLNADRPSFRLFSFLDEYPHVNVLYPGEDIDLPQDLAVDVIVEADDDYGISRLALVWEQDGESHTVPIESKKDSEMDAYPFHWDLIDLPLFPGDTLVYYACAYDNDAISGPKMSRSKRYLIRFPTAEEIYEEVTGGGEQLQETFETGSERLDELKEGLKELEQSLRTSKTLTWEEKQQAEEIIERERELLESIDRARREMEEIAERINEAFLSNPEIREKLEEIEKLMKELATEEVRQRMEQLREALEKMDRKAMLKAMEHMIYSQEEIKKKLDRTIQILERIAQEERFERIAEKAEQLFHEQQRINEALQDHEAAEVEEFSDEQRALQQELEQLVGEMEALAEELGKGDSTARESLEEGATLSDELLKQLEQMQEAMQKGQQQQSLSLGKQSEKQLGELSALMSAGLKSMMSKRKSDLENEYNALINDVIFLSAESEKIMNGLEREWNMDAVLTFLDGVKDGVRRAIEVLSYMKTKSPFISSIAEEELFRAIGFVEQSQDHLVKGNAQGAYQLAKRTMKSLNLAALELIESKQDMPAGGSGSLSQMLQQLQSLAAQQMQLNQGTQGMFPIDMSSGTIPLKTQRELQRLGELQDALAERLRRIEQGLQEEGGSMLGDLGQVADEMEEIAERLEAHSVDRDLVERQERILSRMLDAQRSLHKREFSKEREAERPGVVSGKSPAPLARPDLKRGDAKKDILKELEERYPQEYRDLIRAYFNKLLKEEVD